MEAFSGIFLNGQIHEDHTFLILFVVAFLLLFLLILYVLHLKKKITVLLSEAQVIETKLNEFQSKNLELIHQKKRLEEKQKDQNRIISELENDLILAKDKSEEAERLKTSFLANLSHEVRTPLTAIIGFAGLLNDMDFTPEQRKEFIGHITHNGNSLLHMIDDLLDMSKIEANILEIEPVMCQLNIILIDLFSNYISIKSELGKNKIDLKLNNPLKKENIKIYTDPYRLRQIFEKLLNNAFKYTEEGCIEFGVTKEKEKIVFYVKDTGIGIENDKMKDIFRQFTKIETNTSRLYRGTGIGLTLAKKVVQLLGGDLWADSKPNEGTIFYFNIDLKNTLSEVQEIRYDWSNHTILIAEDEDDNYMLIERILRKYNINLIHAKNGKEALEFIEKFSHIDLVFMDIKMPLLNGIDAFIEIRKKNKNIPVIALTAYALTDEKERISRVGFNSCITKPYRSNEIYSILVKYFLES